MSQRTERIDELLRQEIGAILAKDVADPRVGFVTVTEVDTAPDLAHAKVWVSIIGQPRERDEAFAALGRAMPYVRHLLGERVRLRRVPDLHLRLDTSTERGTRVLHLLDVLEAGSEDVPPPPTGESLPTPVRRLPHEGDTDVPGEGSEAVEAAGPTKPRRRPARRPTDRGTDRRGGRGDRRR